mgnify:CR=1 FL=1
MNLNYFQTENLFDAGKQLLDTLEILLNTNTSEPIDYKQIPGERYKPDNAAELFAQKDIDGGLIGGASLKPNRFLRGHKSIDYENLINSFNLSRK